MALLKLGGKERSEHVPRLLDFIDCFKDAAYLITPYCNAGTLDEAIELERTQRGTHGLPHATALDYCAQMHKGLQYIHSQGVAHGDLKCANILLDARNNSRFHHITINDFGCAKHDPHNKTSASKEGTVEYAAPEQLKCTVRTPYNIFPPDIWSLGLIIFRMDAGELPFAVACADRCALYKYFVALQRFDALPSSAIWDRLQVVTRARIKQMLIVEPTERVTVDQLK